MSFFVSRRAFLSFERKQAGREFLGRSTALRRAGIVGPDIPPHVHVDTFHAGHRAEIRWKKGNCFDVFGNPAIFDLNNDKLRALQ